MIDIDARIRHYYDCFNKRRLADAAALFTADAELEGNIAVPGRGSSGYLQLADAWIRAFPDATLSVESIEPRGETMREVYLLAKGRHCGTLDVGSYHFKPSGADAVLHVRELLDLSGGQIRASSITVEFMDVVRQLTIVDYDELERRLKRIQGLAEELAHAAGEPLERRDVAERLGTELDAARRVIRPHYNR